MADTKTPAPAPGTVGGKPRWEGPPGNRPRGYLPPLNDANQEEDAAGEHSEHRDKGFDEAALAADKDVSHVQEGTPSHAPPPEDTQYAGHPQFSQDAAANKPPDGIGNSEPVDDNDERTRHSEGVNPARPAPQPTSGAAQALARHSKDS